MAQLLRFLLAIAAASAASCNGSSTPAKPASGQPAVGAKAGQTVPAAGADQVAAQGDRTAEPAAPQVALADSPRIDLLHNRFFFHLVDEGLLVPIAGEGFRKYTQEYRKPWGDVVEADGRAGRLLGRDRATLRVPWDGKGEGFVRVRMHGVVARQRLIINVNGKRAGVAGMEAGWQIVVVPVEEGLLRSGENEILVRTVKRGRIAGKRAHGLFHSLELVAGKPTDTERWPALSPAAMVVAGGKSVAALSGFTKLFAFVEIPKQAWLRVDTVPRRARSSTPPRSDRVGPGTSCRWVTTPIAWFVSSYRSRGTRLSRPGASRASCSRRPSRGRAPPPTRTRSWWSWTRCAPTA